MAFLLNNFNTNIIVKEVDKTSVFAERALPQLESFFGVAKVKHIFEESDEPLFHRQKVLNEMIMEADTEIVVNYDCDVILPLNSYVTAYEGIMNGTFDVVYPYGSGMFQRQVNAEDKLVSEFLDSNDFGALDRPSRFIAAFCTRSQSSSDLKFASSGSKIFYYLDSVFDHLQNKLFQSLGSMNFW